MHNSENIAAQFMMDALAIKNVRIQSEIFLTSHFAIKYVNSS